MVSFRVLSQENMTDTVDSRFLETPGETQIGSRNQRVRESGVTLHCLTEEREQLLVRVIGRFEKMRVREIGIPLYVVLELVP